jgi:hydrogenase expression/formation protein HypE
LGFDPLYVANEGKLVAITSRETAEIVVDKMSKNPYGSEATIIGEIVSEPTKRVLMKTQYGTTRILEMLSGELLPRIC